MFQIGALGNIDIICYLLSTNVLFVTLNLLVLNIGLVIINLGVNHIN